MSIEAQIKRFYIDIERAASALLDFEHDIQLRQYKIREALNQLNGILPADTHSEVSGNLKNLCNKVIDRYRQGLSEWSTGLDQYTANKQFVNKFEKSMMLVVFANVNTGKSTLGNFISGLYLKGTPFEHLYKEPIFYRYDWSGYEVVRSEQEIEDNQFKEGDVETTSTIQYFTLLRGLTWVDTPGIHSLTLENEQLAKQYVQFSDLVLFLMPSTDPGKADEMREMEQLMRNEKPMLVAITKSDQKRKTIVNGQITLVVDPKSEERRRQQELLIDQSILESGVFKAVRDKRYISVSVDIAKEALLRNDPELFTASGIPRLYEQIGTVITEQAIELKQQRPRSEVNTLIREIREGLESSDSTHAGLNGLREDVHEVQKSLRIHKQQIDGLHEEIVFEIRGRASVEIGQQLVSMRNTGREITAETVSALVERSVIDICNEILAKKVSTVLEGFQRTELHNLHFRIDTKLDEQTQQLDYEQYVMKTVERDPRNVLEWLGYIVLDNKYTEQVVGMKKVSRNVKVGDNLNEVIYETLEQMNQQLTIHVRELLESVKREYFEELDALFLRLQNELKVLDRQLEELKYI